MNEFDENEEEFDDGRPHPMHKIGKIIAPIFTCFCLIVTVMIFFRICSQNKIPESIGTMAANDDLKQAYDASVNRGESLKVIYQDFDIYSTENDVRVDENGKKIRNAGRAYFAVPIAVFIPEANQAQLVLRYNNSTLKYLASDYREICTEVPERNEDVFDITLVKVTDLTPDKDDDNNDPRYLAEKRYTLSSVISAEKGLHNFRRLTFEDFDLEGALRVYLCIYYKGAVDYGEQPYATVTVYDAKDVIHTYKLTNKDVAAIEAYGK